MFHKNVKSKPSKLQKLLIHVHFKTIIEKLITAEQLLLN